jgi:Ankyrin repeats (3 copies)
MAHDPRYNNVKEEKNDTVSKIYNVILRHIQQNADVYSINYDNILEGIKQGGHQVVERLNEYFDKPRHRLYFMREYRGREHYGGYTLLMGAQMQNKEILVHELLTDRNDNRVRRLIGAQENSLRKTVVHIMLENLHTASNRSIVNLDNLDIMLQTAPDVVLIEDALHQRPLDICINSTSKNGDNIIFCNRLLNHMDENKHDIDKKNSDGMTYLMYASKKNVVSIMEQLMDRGAEVDLQDNEGMTALMIASKAGNVAAALCLLGRGAELDIQNKKGETALMIASKHSKYDIVELLLLRGARHNIKNSNKKSAKGLSKTKKMSQKFPNNNNNNSSSRRGGTRRR